MSCVVENNGMKFIKIKETDYLNLSSCIKRNPFLIFIIYPN